jgi:ABC-type amino acid transport substrate-binding protein
MGTIRRRKPWMAVLVLAACGAAAAQDLAAIRGRGALRVIYGREMRPESFAVQQDAPPGLDRELIEGFASLNRLKVELVEVPTGAERIKALVAGKGDVAVGLGVTEERRKTIAFTSEVFPTRHVAVTRRPHPRVETVEQLRAMRVGSVKGSSWAATLAAARVPPENVDTSFATAVDVIEGLRKGQIAAIVMPVDWALLEMRNDPQLELGLYLGPPVGRVWAVRKDSPELLAAFDDYLANVRKSGAWSRLVVKYYGELTLEAVQKSRTAP